MNSLGKRIVVMGITSSGKSTFARELSSMFDYKHIEYDKLQLQPNYEKRNPDDVSQNLNNLIFHTEAWIYDGWIYEGSETNHKADTFIWLDYPIWVNYWRVLKRSWTLIGKRQTSWSNDMDISLWQALRMSIWLILWIRRSKSRTRRGCKHLFTSPVYDDKYKIRLKSPKQAKALLDELRLR